MVHHSIAVVITPFLTNFVVTEFYEVRREHLPRTRLRVSLPFSKRRGFKKSVEHLFLQMEPLFALCLCEAA
jgi:hypothetical protein